MRLPEEIMEKIIDMSFDLDKKEIARDFRKISDRYMGEKSGESLLNKDGEAFAYAIGRMPATYSATFSACKQSFEMIEKSNLDKIHTLIDVGSGTGAATIAACELHEFENVLCFEREDSMINLSKKLLDGFLDNISWQKTDFNTYKGNNIADMVVASYFLNELSKNNIFKIVDAIWDMTEKLLVIVEPGTPEDYERIVSIKDYLISKGGVVVAPCMGNGKCNLPANDWCNFSCRVERSKVQKEVKHGVVPYEDEKFTYLAVAKDGIERKTGEFGRIIRHPIIRSNMVELKMCLNGQILNKIYTKKDKEVYKKARKSNVGETMEI